MWRVVRYATFDLRLMQARIIGREPCLFSVLGCFFVSACSAMGRFVRF